MKNSVFIVTGSSQVRQELNSFFKARQYEVTFGKFGSRTVLELLEKSVNIFIMDFKRCDRTYLDIVKIIKHAVPSLPIIALCDDTSVTSVRELLQAGVFYCAMKPVQLTEIEQIVEGLERSFEKQNMSG